jgi:hypothetical protein
MFGMSGNIFGISGKMFVCPENFFYVRKKIFAICPTILEENIN